MGYCLGLCKVIFITFLVAATGIPSVSAFTFSGAEEQEAQEEAQKQQALQMQINHMTAVPCRAAIKNRKIAVMIGEMHGQKWLQRNPAQYNSLFQIINQRLRDLGLKTYTQKEITAQIAQAEMDAFLANDMDAAANAASRLKADFILRGTIRANEHFNPVVKVKQVSVHMGFTLVNAAGRTVADLTEQGESYAGVDTLAVAKEIVKEKADFVVARLYHDYCRWAASKPASKKMRPTQKAKSVKDF